MRGQRTAGFRDLVVVVESDAEHFRGVADRRPESELADVTDTGCGMRVSGGGQGCCKVPERCPVPSKELPCRTDNGRVRVAAATQKLVDVKYGRGDQHTGAPVARGFIGNEFHPFSWIG